MDLFLPLRRGVAPLDPVRLAEPGTPAHELLTRRDAWRLTVAGGDRPIRLRLAVLDGPLEAEAFAAAARALTPAARVSVGPLAPRGVAVLILDRHLTQRPLAVADFVPACLTTSIEIALLDLRAPPRGEITGSWELDPSAAAERFGGRGVVLDDAAPAP